MSPKLTTQVVTLNGSLNSYAHQPVHRQKYVLNYFFIFM